jgi:hypothetical protein
VTQPADPSTTVVLDQATRVYETYWTTGRGAEVMAPDWPPIPQWPGGRPIAQWPRIDAGRSDDLS